MSVRIHAGPARGSIRERYSNIWTRGVQRALPGVRTENLLPGGTTLAEWVVSLPKTSSAAFLRGAQDSGGLERLNSARSTQAARRYLWCRLPRTAVVGGENLIRAFVGCWMIVCDTHSWRLPLPASGTPPGACPDATEFSLGTVIV